MKTKRLVQNLDPACADDKIACRSPSKTVAKFTFLRMQASRVAQY